MIRRKLRFTVVEVCVVIAIIVLLASIISPLVHQNCGSPLVWTQANIRQAEVALIMHHEATGQWAAEDGWQEEIAYYLGDETLHDAWSSPLQYRNDGAPIVYSLGPNQRDERGGGDDVVFVRKASRLWEYIHQLGRAGFILPERCEPTELFRSSRAVSAG